MDHKKSRRVRKIEVPTYTPTEFEFGNMAADIQRGREEREAGESEEEAQKQREEARRQETTHSAWWRRGGHISITLKAQEGTHGGGEAGTSQSHSRHKKGHMTNIYLTDSDEEAIVDFGKDHEELYHKTNEHCKDKGRNECLWERFANIPSCLSKCARLGTNPKGLATTNSHSSSLLLLKK